MYRYTYMIYMYNIIYIISPFNKSCKYAGTTLTWVEYEWRFGSDANKQLRDSLNSAKRIGKGNICLAIRV